MNILQLLGLQQGAAQAGMSGIDPATGEIVINGVREPQAPVSPVAAQTPEISPLKNLVIPEVARVAPQQDPSKEILPRSGLFGMKGTLRNVLGILGDAFLIQSGNKPIYTPIRQQERLGDAMYGYTQDPMAAIERMAGAGFGQESADLYNDYQTNLYKQEMGKSLKESRENASANRDANNVRKALLVAQQMKQAGVPDEVIQQLVRSMGIDPVDILPDETVPGYATSAMSVDKQLDQPRRDARVAQGQRRVEIAQQNADRPRQGRAPRAETRDERFIRLNDRDPAKLTKGEKAWLDDQRQMRSRKGAPAGGPPKVDTSKHRPGSTVKFRNGKTGVVQKDGSIKLN